MDQDKCKQNVHRVAQVNTPHMLRKFDYFFVIALFVIALFVIALFREAQAQAYSFPFVLAGGGRDASDLSPHEGDRLRLISKEG